MNLKAFKKWYMIHVNEIISDGSGAVHSAKILQLLNDLNVFDNIETLNKTRSNEKREFILDVIKLAASFVFNILLCGMVFSYERFAPIITKCFGWVRPMPI